MLGDFRARKPLAMKPRPTQTELHQARDEFRGLLARQTKASQWQKFFTENPYVLSMSLPLKLDPGDIVPLARPGRTEPDFVFYPRDGASGANERHLSDCLNSGGRASRTGVVGAVNRDRKSSWENCMGPEGEQNGAEGVF